MAKDESLVVAEQVIRGACHGPELVIRPTPRTVQLVQQVRHRHRGQTRRSQLQRQRDAAAPLCYLCDVGGVSLGPPLRLTGVADPVTQQL